MRDLQNCFLVSRRTRARNLILSKVFDNKKSSRERIFGQIYKTHKEYIYFHILVVKTPRNGAYLFWLDIRNKYLKHIFTLICTFAKKCCIAISLEYN